MTRPVDLAAMRGFYGRAPFTTDDQYLKMVMKSPEKIDALVKQRDEARKVRDFETADRLRQQIAGLAHDGWHIELLDEPAGTFWYWTQRKPK